MIHGRFFDKNDKMTFRKVIDRVGVFSAVECLAYIESSRQAMYELHKVEHMGKLVYDKEQNERTDLDHQPLVDYINTVIDKQGKSTEGDIDANRALDCIRDIIAQDIMSVYQNDGYGSTNYDDIKVMDILLADESRNLTMWPRMQWSTSWNPKNEGYRKLYDKYVDLHWKLDSDADDYDENLSIKKFEQKTGHLTK